MGNSSALDPGGHEAVQIAELFWFMTVGAGVIWTAVMVLTLYAVRAQPGSIGRRGVGLIIVGGGMVIPTIVLTILLVNGLAKLPSLVASAPRGSQVISVSGELWWWRVRYWSDENGPIDLANEIHLPVGEPAEFLLNSDNVIHAFWIPALAGKVDMIPGRDTRLSLTPTRTGVYRGVCAEYCGTSHALMKFLVVVHPRSAFDDWIAHQARPALAPTDPLAKRGQEVFLSNGCSACHTVRGTSAAGVIGPDLTHVGSRRSIAGGSLPVGPDGFRHWIAQPDRFKPAAHMPGFGMLPDEELKALATYLVGLK